MKPALFLLLFGATAMAAPNKELITVPVGIAEALSTTDSTSSQRYRERFEAALYFAIGESEKQLNQCGYRYLVQPRYFDASNPQDAVAASETLSNAQVWAAFGPRRSEDFLAMTPKMKETVFVTPMANSREIELLPFPYFMMYPTTHDFAEGVLEALTKEKYGKRYASIVDVRCPACKDLDSDVEKSKKYEKVFTYDIGSDEPALEGLTEKLKAAEAEAKLDFILLPNNSRASGFVISKLQKEFPHLKYVGAHGWGDAHYGFLFAYGVDPNVKGFCVRAGREFADMVEAHNVRSVDYMWKGERVSPNYTAFSAVHFMRELTKDLCRYRPKDREEFLKKMKNLSREAFRMKEPLSVYALKESKLSYDYVLKGAK